MFLIVYVDDFKMAGPVEHFDKLWKLILGLIEMDPPEPVNTFLGCNHAVSEITVDNSLRRVMVYDMAKRCVTIRVETRAR